MSDGGVQSPRHLRLAVVESRMRNGLVSLRLDADHDSATALKRALTEAGFEAGESAVLVPAAWFDAVCSR